MIIDSTKFLLSLGFTEDYITNHRNYTPTGELLSLKEILDRFYNLNVAAMANKALETVKVDVDDMLKNTLLCDCCGMRNDKKELVCINCGSTI